jgi:hypothetical protein
MTRIHKRKDIKSWEQPLPQKKIKSLRQAVTCFVFFDIRIWITWSKVRWKWECSFRWKQHNQRATHWICSSVHSHMSEENPYEITKKKVSQEWVRFSWARNAGSVWSPVLCSFLKNSSLRRLRVSGFAASDEVLHTQCRENQNVFAWRELSTTRLCTSDGIGTTTKLPTIPSQKKCNHFWNFSNSSPLNGAHFAISHPHNAQDYKIWLQHAFRRSVRVFLAYSLRRV